MQMLCTVFACMTWPDSTVCHKATRLAMSFIREVCADSLNSVNSSFAVLEALQRAMVEEKRLWGTDVMQRIILFHLGSLQTFCYYYQNPCCFPFPPYIQCWNTEKLQAPVFVSSGGVEPGMGCASDVVLGRGCLFQSVKKRQKCEFVPKLSSKIVGIV